MVEAKGRFWRFLGPGNYKVEVSTKGPETVQEHMESAPEIGRGTFMRIIDESGLAIFVDTDSFDRVVEVPYIDKDNRHSRT